MKAPVANRQDAKVATYLEVAEPGAKLDDLARRATGARSSEALCVELAARRIRRVRQMPIGVKHKGKTVGEARTSAGLLINFNVTLLQRGITRVIQTR